MHIVLISTYELGRQPFGLASPAAWLRQNGMQVSLYDLALTQLDDDAIRQADLIAFYLPMHTATRLALPLIAQIRAINPGVHLCCYGLYAPLNAEYLYERGVDYVIGGEYEEPLLNLVTALAGGDTVPPEGISTRHNAAPPHLARLPFIAPARGTLPPLKHYAHLESNGRRSPAG